MKKSILLLTVLLISAFQGMARASVVTADEFTQYRVFAAIPEKLLPSLFSEANSVGVRKVYNMTLVKKYIQQLAESCKEEDKEDCVSSVSYSERKAAFELENVNDQWNNDKIPQTFAVDVFSASEGYMDDRNPPQASFLKIAGQWYLLPLANCEQFNPSEATSDFNEASILSISILRGSGGITWPEICSVNFTFAGKNTIPVISGIKAWRQER